MREAPNFIQTPSDLQNLFAMAVNGELEKAEVAVLVRSLWNRQFHNTRIVSVDGVKVVTRYFPEVKENDTTRDGITIKGVKHIESEEEENQFEETHITLSKAPTDKEVLSVFMEQNFLSENDFDVERVKTILEVLDNA
jgi:hypothetical protein